MSEIEKFMEKYDSADKDYKILDASSLEDIEEKINNSISRGYKPTGNIFKEDDVFHQAMIKGNLFLTVCHGGL